jgi:hypothetical protein
MSQNPNRMDSLSVNSNDFQLGEYISKGFNIFGKNAGLFIGYFVVYCAISFFLSIIPFLGTIASLMISGALVAGFYIAADKTERGEHLEFGNFFDGFKSWVPLFINTLLLLLMAIGLMIPFIVYFIAKIGMAGLSDLEDNLSGFGAIDGVVFLIMFIALMYISIAFVYSTFFIVFDKMEAWAAMMASRKVVEKTFFWHLLFFFIWGLIMMISILPLLLGLLVTVPAFCCSVYAAWADLTDYHKEETAEDDDILRHLIE